MHDPAYIKELFSRFLTDSCTPEEIEVLIDYLKNAGDDSDFLPVEEFQAMFPDLPGLGADSSERISRDLSREIKKDTVLKKRPPEKFLQKHSWIQIAAAVVLLLAVSAVFFIVYNQLAPEKYLTGNAEITTVMLDDGTLVTLNANSVLKADLQGDGKREVWLDGEAFFRVAHDAGRKFIVHTSRQLAVEVLGTEFNVKDRPGGTSVVLNKGSVRIKLRENRKPDKELLIKPGEMIEYKPDTHTLSRSLVDTVKYSSWKRNLLIFEEASLALVGHTIENQFGYSVKFESDSIAALHFTGSNPADNLDLLLETLERSFDLSVEKKGRELMMSSKKKDNNLN